MKMIPNEACSRRRWIWTTAMVGAASTVIGSRQRNELWAQGRPTNHASAPSDPPSEFDPIVEPAETQVWRFGMSLRTPVTCTDVFATFPVPRNWPEQTIQKVGEDLDSRFQWKIRTAAGQLADQILIASPRVNAGSTANFIFEIEIQKQNLLVPEKKIGELTAPKKLDRSLKVFLGKSPNIDKDSALIRRAYRDLAPTLPTTAWDRVEAIYDWVREKVSYVEGPIRNASDALKDGQGDCEDMTSLFVAMCRNDRIPARMVWIPGHCYPEFCLHDPDGNPHWYPCQAAGTRQFGEMKESRPIMQKGDRFKVPESDVAVRYLAETFRCGRKGRGKPKPSFMMKQVQTAAPVGFQANGVFGGGANEGGANEGGANGNGANGNGANEGGANGNGTNEAGVNGNGVDQG